MRSFSTLLTAFGLVKFGIAGYTLQDDYTPSKFFDMFDFFTDADPTHGFVEYVDQATAQSNSLIGTFDNSVTMGVDNSTVTTTGRQSVRLTSKASYNEALIILDLAHMPGSVCGSWPAFWAVGPNWPNNGEIDIIEGVNSQQDNAMTLHTGPGCSISQNSDMTGTIETANCDVNAPDQSTNAGCSIGTDAAATYGDDFNSVGGGVYATNWNSDFISIYHFSRGSIPSDISSGNPDPSGWGKPLAKFSGDCDIATSFKDMNIVFDITFCGDWAGAVFSTDATCSSKASTCTDYVGNNPEAFEESYWKVNSLQVYSASSDEISSSSIVSSSSSVAVPEPISSTLPLVSLSSSTTTTSSAAAVSSTATSTNPAGISTTLAVTTKPLSASQTNSVLSPTVTVSTPSSKKSGTAGFVGSSHPRSFAISTFSFISAKAGVARVTKTVTSVAAARHSGAAKVVTKTAFHTVYVTGER